MVGTAAVDRYQPRRDERLSYILREPEPRHRFGISALAVGDDYLFSAGRDGTVRAWTLPPTPATSTPATSITTTASTEPSQPYPNTTPTAVKTFDEHVDWVNDVTILPTFQRLVSCSSDTTVKVWNPSDPSRSLRTLASHTDYVKALAPVPGAVASGAIASGGLDARVLVWDLITGRVDKELTAGGGSGGEDPSARSASVYAMAGAPEANVLVSGSTDKTVTVWDVRSGERVVRLRGHADSVRCLALARDARFMLSGSTDATVKLWDLRQERCVRTFDAFDASVWALAATDSFETFVCGARDGGVYHADIRAGAVTPVVPPDNSSPRAAMVLDIALTKDADAVWVSSTGSNIRLWALPGATSGGKAEPDSVGGTGDGGAMGMATSEPPQPSKQQHQQQEFEMRANEAIGELIRPEPLYEITGLPGIVAHRIMNDRRHVLTCNTAGEYQIWDITRGVLDQSLGVVDEFGDIDEVLKQKDTEVSVPSWFHVDIRLGSLMVRLEKSSVASAEVYAVDAGLEAPSPETKFNIGEHVLHGLFRKWLERQRAKGIRTISSEDGLGQGSNGTAATSTSTSNAATGGQGKGNGAKTPSADLPPYEFPDHIAVVVTEDQSPVPILRSTVGNFKGNEDIHMPPWVLDLVRDGKRLPFEVVKLSFTLEPEEGSKLPQFNATTLTAPRVLRVAKVAAYVSKELREIDIAKDGSDIRNELNFDIEASHLEIVCNEQVLPVNMSLATVRQFRWRSPEDIKLFFRLRPAS